VANSSTWAWVQQDSVSTSVPSQSNATARGIHPSNGHGLLIWGTVCFLFGGTDGMLRRDVNGTWQRAGRDGRIRAPSLLPPSRARRENEHDQTITHSSRHQPRVTWKRRSWPAHVASPGNPLPAAPNGHHARTPARAGPAQSLEGLGICCRPLFTDMTDY
jgi:hypothetical protein